MLRSTDTPSFISATEAALRLGVSAETVRKHCRTGTYPAERRNTPYGPAWFVDASALPAQPVPEDAPNITEGAPDSAPASDAVVTALTSHIDDLRRQLATQATAHTEAMQRLREDHAREIATLRDVNRDQYAILERLSVPRLADSQSSAPRPWWRIW
jgi:hypothetical protein